MSSKEFKMNALNRIKFNLLNVFIFCIVYFSFYLITFQVIYYFDFYSIEVEKLCLIIYCFLTILLGFGNKNYFLKIARNEVTSCKELFIHSNNFLLYFIMIFLFSLFVSLWSLLFVIPGIIAYLAYSMIFYIKIDNPGMKLLDVFKRSKLIMKGNKTNLLCLFFSFIGWFILSLFTYGFLIIFIYPYMQISFALFYDKIKNNIK